MKRHFVTLLFGLSILASTSAGAGKWLCSAGSGPTTEAICYVTSVRFNPGSRPYVQAEIHDPEEDTVCKYIMVRVGEHDTEDVETVRGSESLLLVALTTGLPVKFYVHNEESGNCYASSIIVAKPGN